MFVWHEAMERYGAIQFDMFNHISSIRRGSKGQLGFIFIIVVVTYKVNRLCLQIVGQ
ncbi:hypothetical protein HXA31_07105 [Salipaludibacillus agaradhaerens]|uniref:Uncharacterized protein n=1 Tax=Salipaludibacillus agaradhaerens TaxID=76935 RepID=A0A9Q4B1I7_SALAG|nr:hypothetical protein [Salipaludibacillus agaradhaerens]MCR6096310.1 hypothetical protein [Salipaludibacillus agaradhaerens]MCR6114131.1 hypothetical protein [Salipaludibacillus agaradhaerens]